MLNLTFTLFIYKFYVASGLVEKLFFNILCINRIKIPLIDFERKEKVQSVKQLEKLIKIVNKKH